MHYLEGPLQATMFSHGVYTIGPSADMTSMFVIHARHNCTIVLTPHKDYLITEVK
jgi:hypothetical protein